MLIGGVKLSWWGPESRVKVMLLMREERLGRVWLEAGAGVPSWTLWSGEVTQAVASADLKLVKFRAGDTRGEIFSLLMVLRRWEWMRPLGEKKNFEVWAWTPHVEKRRQEQSRLRGTADSVGGSQEAKRSDVQMPWDQTRREGEPESV